MVPGMAPGNPTPGKPAGILLAALPGSEPVPFVPPWPTPPAIPPVPADPPPTPGKAPPIGTPATLTPPVPTETPPALALTPPVPAVTPPALTLALILPSPLDPDPGTDTPAWLRLVPELAVVPDGRRPVEKSGKLPEPVDTEPLAPVVLPALPPDEAPTLPDGIDGIPPDDDAPDDELEADGNELADPDDELDDGMDEGMDDRDDDEEPDGIDEEDDDEDDEEEDADGMDDDDDDGMDGVDGMLVWLCVWLVVSQALSMRALRPMAITNLCCDIFMIDYSACQRPADNVDYLIRPLCRVIIALQLSQFQSRPPRC